MKKVKIMLMSALVVAAVGGALAFKAQKLSPALYCSDTPGICPNTTDDEFTFKDASEDSHLPHTFCSITNTGCTYVLPE